MNLPKSVECLIIGAGAIGSFTAYNLASRGHEVLVLERRVPGVEASGVNAGSLGVQNKPIRLVSLAAESVRMWEKFSDESGYDLGYHRTGGLRVAETEEGADRLRALASEQSAAGIDVTFLADDEVHYRAPYLSRNVCAANYCPLDGHNNSLVATPLVARAAARRGAEFALGVDAQSIKSDGSGVTVTTSKGQVSCEKLIITAGVWARDFLVNRGVELPVVLRSNQSMVTEPADDFIDHAIFHVDGHLTVKQVHPAGSCLIGGGWPGSGNFRQLERDVNVNSLTGNALLATRVIPALADYRILRSWSGFDWRTVDQMPVLGPLPHSENIFVCTSCYGGYTLSPILGQVLATLVADGTPRKDFEGFLPSQTSLKEL
jgi:sarcosine oxidase, subunit beta